MFELTAESLALQAALGVTALPRQTQLVYHPPKEKELFSDFSPQNVELFPKEMCPGGVWITQSSRGKALGVDGLS